MAGLKSANYSKDRRAVLKPLGLGWYIAPSAGFLKKYFEKSFGLAGGQNFQLAL